MLLTGFSVKKIFLKIKAPKKKEIQNKIKIYPKRLKTEGDFYKKSRDLMEKGKYNYFNTYIVNPKVIEFEKKKCEMDKNNFEKRRNKQLLITNFSTVN